MKCIIYFLLFSFLLFSCKTKEIKSNGIVEEKTYYLNGNLMSSTEKKNGISEGKYFSYYENGNIWGAGTYINGTLNGAFVTYTPSGDTAIFSTYKNGQTITKKVFWQPVNDEETEFLYVSKNGFITCENGRYKILDSSTPDNIIELKLKGDQLVRYIWKNGNIKIFDKDDYKELINQK